MASKLTPEEREDIRRLRRRRPDFAPAGHDIHAEGIMLISSPRDVHRDRGLYESELEEGKTTEVANPA